jgi:molybdopterin-guanine dinucleotide biosynthesis protein A
LVVGIFVGGQSSRMGGAPKGLLQAPDSMLSLVERLIREVEAAVPRAEIVLVGSAAAYAALPRPVVADAPRGIGPLGGLLGLLHHAERAGARQVLALACDLPRLERQLLERLCGESPNAAALLVAPGAIRNPLIARYSIAPALAAGRAALDAGKRSLQAVLDQLGPSVVTLSVSPAEQATLEDWDTPTDVGRRAR